MLLINRKLVGRTVLLFLAIGILVTPVHAQTNYGSVRGLVEDIQGGVIADAEVKLTNLGTNVVHTTKSNSSGEYLFTQIDLGDYAVEVSMAELHMKFKRADDGAGTGRDIDRRCNAAYRLELRNS